ncbi:hypothetical protein THIX_30140 [Thiomonas sp. X19]|nr:hypothetical protein THIX_30140 [Thiomonas sp. X19]
MLAARLEGGLRRPGRGLPIKGPSHNPTLFTLTLSTSINPTSKNPTQPGFRLIPELENTVRATLNKSLVRIASAPRAVCGVANPRHSLGYGCGLRLASHPDARRAASRELVQRRLRLDLV